MEMEMTGPNMGHNDNDGQQHNGTAGPVNGSGHLLPEAEAMQPPVHLISDYVEIAYLGAVITAGLVLNCLVLKRLLREKWLSERSNRQQTNAFLLLKLNLNISDILILLLHAAGKMGWLITYEWRFGDSLCRLFNLLSMFTLYLSSNIVICIALDRLLTVLNAKKINFGEQKLSFVRLMLFCAWSLSLLFSVPQLFVWKCYNPFKGSTGWVQCTDIWSINRYERYLLEQRSPIEGGVKTMASRGELEEFVLSKAVQNAYELVHLFLVFYGPLLALVVCYALISTRLIRFATDNPCSTSLQQSSQENGRRLSIPTEKRAHFKRASGSMKSFPVARLYAPLGVSRRKSHQQVPMMHITEVSTRLEETAAENLTVQSLENIHKLNNGDQPLLDGQRHHSQLSNNSLPNFPIQNQSNDKNECDDKANNRRMLPSRPSANIGQRHCSSSNSSLSSTVMQPSDDGKITDRRIFVRIRLSFRESLRRLRSQQGRRRLRGTHWSNTSLNELKMDGGKAQKLVNNDRRQQGVSSQGRGGGGGWKRNICLPWTALRLRMGAGRDKNNATNGLCAPSAVAFNPQQQNGTGGHQFPPGPGLCRHSPANHSVRSSLSTAASISTVARGDRAGQQLWRRHLRSRAFRTTLLVILVHLLLWSPYNVYALMKHVNEHLYERMSEQANVLKDLQFLITLINPFLYGLGQRMAAGSSVKNKKLGAL